MTRLERTFNYLTGFTPVILMAGLAMFSFALVKQTNYVSLSHAANTRPNSDQDYYLNMFSISKYSYHGKINAHINGKQAQHFEKSQELSVEHFQFLFMKSSDQSFGSSDKAIVNDDANTIAMTGNVKMRLKINSF